MKKMLYKRIQLLSSFFPLLSVSFLILLSFIALSQNIIFSVVPSNVFAESGSSNNKQSEISGQKIEDTEAEETPESVETPEVEEFDKEEEVEVKEGTGESKVTIRSGKNKFEFQQDGAKVSVESDFPLSVNPITKELTVTTPSGSKVVAVLPQQAIDNMLANGTVTSASAVDLKTEKDGSLTYDIDGVKNEKILGVFNVAIPKNIIVSSQTGEVLVVNQSIFSRILDFLSI